MKKSIFLLFSCFILSRFNAQKELWGMTFAEGLHNAGIIFKTDSSGNNPTIEYNFFQNEGELPDNSKLIQASDGFLYGMTQRGGRYAHGVIFRYNPSNNTYTKKFEFNSAVNGKYPLGSLMQASNGKLYGTTSYGGVNDLGILFEYDPVTNVFLKIIDFNGLNGKIPDGLLIESPNGTLYGTAYGGAYNKGVIFQYDINLNIFTKKIDFPSSFNGSTPNGNIMVASNGNIYGMTIYGGTNDEGVIFEYNPNSNSFSKKFDFNSTASGAHPEGGLIECSDGNLYGLTSLSGINNNGTLFQFDPLTSVFTKKLDFGGAATGTRPTGSLFQASNGMLYGLTPTGGVNNNGILFQYDFISNTFSNKFNFSGFVDGNRPYGTLMQASDGNLYGMTCFGGSNNSGVMFQFNISTDVFNKKIDFSGATQGELPTGALMEASDGIYYGYTSRGGTHNLGTIFKYNPANHVLNKLNDFTGASNGMFPVGSLVQASNSNLYGMTSQGGLHGCGTLFEYNIISGIFAKKLDFDSILNGKTPFTSLTKSLNGMLYGLTTRGGINNLGVLFEYNPSTNVLSKKIDFAGTANGAWPYGNLVETSTGHLYGTTQGGGINNKGSIFQYNQSTNILTKKYDFVGSTSGESPAGSLIQASDGKLYGSADEGINSKGVLFQFDPNSNIYTKIYDHTDMAMVSMFIQGSDGNLYGVVFPGQFMFQYNFSTNGLTKKIDFSVAEGLNPSGNLMEVNHSVLSIKKYSEVNNFSIIPNPTTDIIHVTANEMIKSIQVESIQGQIMYSESINAKSHQLELRSINEGIYFVKLIFANGTSITTKIIKM